MATVTPKPRNGAFDWTAIQKYAAGLATEAVYNLAATGTNQGTAVPAGEGYTHFQTVPANTGTILPVATVQGHVYIIDNAGANPLFIYPAVNTKISGGIANAPITLNADSTGLFISTAYNATADAYDYQFVLLGGGSGGGGGVPASRTLFAGTGMTGGGDLSADRTFNVIANADGSIIANANDIQVGVLASDAQHGNRGGGGIHALATTSVAGFMSANDKRKVDTWLNVLDYGADPTGVADSITAFEAAQVAAGTMTTGFVGILVPKGTYKLTRTLNLTYRNITWKGAGPNHTFGTALVGQKGFSVVKIAYLGPVSGGGSGSVLDGIQVEHQSGTVSWQPSTGGYVANQSAVIPVAGYNGTWENYNGFILRCIKTGTSGAVEPTWASHNFGNRIGPGGLVRAANVVTATTVAAHGKSPGDTIYVTSDDRRFNEGYFTVASVIDANNLTYADTGVNATSWGKAYLCDIINDNTTAWIKVYVAGVMHEAKAVVTNCVATGIGGDGFSVYASTGDYDNANGWRWDHLDTNNNIGWGFLTIGADSNAGLANDCFGIINGWGGFLESSFLGNTYISCGVENNGINRYSPGIGPGIIVPAVAVNNCSNFFGSYMETGQRGLINGRAMFFGGIHPSGVYGTGNIVANDRVSTLYFLNDTNNDGTGTSAYVRVGRPSSQTLLEFGLSDNTGGLSTAIQFGPGAVNGGGVTGIISFGTSLATNYALTYGTYADIQRASQTGAGYFWIPNGLYHGPAETLRCLEIARSSGPPTSGNYLQGDRTKEISPQVSGMYAFLCYETGAPGNWAGVQAAITRSGSADYTASNPKEFYYGFTSLAADTTYTLPTGSSVAAGLEIIVKDESGSAGTPYAILVAPGGSDTIDGSTSALRIASAYGFVRLVRRNNNWFVVEQSLSKRVVVRTTSLTLTSRYNNYTFHNTGATSQVQFTLPASPQIGDEFEFYVDDTDGIRVIANTGQTIRVLADISASAGYTESAIQGACIRVKYLKSNYWVATTALGTWTTV